MREGVDSLFAFVKISGSVNVFESNIVGIVPELIFRP